MTIKELREKNDKELERLLAELREKTRVHRFRLAANRQKDVREVREVKKDIARVLTLLRSRKES